MTDCPCVEIRKLFRFAVKEAIWGVKTRKLYALLNACTRIRMAVVLFSQYKFGKWA